MSNPTQAALSVQGVKHASLRRRDNEPWNGVVYDGSTGIEFDVSQDGRRWYVSDDDGRRHYGLTLRGALRRGIRRNKRKVIADAG